MWTAASTTAVLATVFSNTGLMLFTVISYVVTGLVALLGLGFAVRKLAKYIFGAPSFQDVMGTSYKTAKERDDANDWINRSGL